MTSLLLQIQIHAVTVNGEYDWQMMGAIGIGSFINTF
jgi:hypothetical protein